MTEWEKGLQAFQQGRLHEAADKLREAALEHERKISLRTRFSTLCHLGAAQYALGRPAEAVSAFEGAVRLAPPPAPPPGLLINLANAYLAAGRPLDGRRVLQEALRNAPGNAEAQMLLQRLDRHVPAEPLSGTIFGEGPEGVRRYLATLSFSRVPQGGLEPSQVQFAIAQVGRYLDLLAEQVAARGEIIANLEAELAWVRQQLNDPKNERNAEAAAMTPLEVLFQKKP